MVVIGMGQVQMSLNINALPVSIGNIVDEFDTAPTTVGTAIVAYSLAVAGFVMLGVLQNTTATPPQIDEAVSINAAARLRSLKLSFLLLAGISLLMIVPSRGLPRYVPGEVPSNRPNPLAEEAALRT